MKTRIYLDHAATTYLDPRVKKTMESFWIENFGNPSSLYLEARTAKKAIEDSRKKIAKLINARPEEIIFTAGGTESDNLAIFGMTGSLVSTWKRSFQVNNPHIITT
ncbi:MAG: aminotransferase class V-fold PLP-dependent enzyme, partial [Candidatus Parcubacteria bacterium]|nr:aminotransferase class V-fold PLP-dependent enzyme [Candidatus Parcubacteria bacterium]